MTQLLVLGLLKKEPLSGYDIQVMLQTSDAESWGGVLVGSIYHALKKLEKDGYVEIASIEQTGHRQKVIYQITAEGELQFKKLLIEALQSNSITYPTLLYSGLNFLDYLETNQAKQALKLQKKVLEQEQEKLMDGKNEKKKYVGENLHPICELIFDNMSSTIQQQIILIDKIINLI